MEKKILSPLKTWENFNPVQAPLEISIVNTYTKNGIIYNEIFFTADTIDDEKLRVFGIIAFIQEQQDNPIAMVIPDSDFMPNENFIENFIHEGYVFATFNYSGNGVEGKTTMYPESLSYAKYDKNADLCKVEINSKHTPWFVWAKIARRCISVLKKQFENPKIALIGINIGGNIGWQVAGTDGRINCFVSINGGGYIESLGYYKYSELKKPEANTNWLAGVAPQAYARFVNCPVYYVGGSNCPNSDMDKIQDLMALVPTDNKYCLISPVSEGEITLGCMDSIKNWIKKFLNNDEFLVDTQIAYKNSENKLYLNINVIEKENLNKIRIYCAEKEYMSNIRNWRKIKDYTDLGNGEYLVSINANAIDNRLFTFVNTYYNDGIILTSKLATIIPKDINIETEKLVKKPSSRVIYNGSMGTNRFSADTTNLIVDRNNITRQVGGFDIVGITSKKGDLYTFNVGDEKYRFEEDSTLQLDVYSLEDKTITLEVYNLEDNMLIPYKVDFLISSNEQWQKVTIEAKNLKNDALLSLNNFVNIKKLKFKNAEKVIFNNILWV